jgi:tetratricopeptide (TPR) repeat protein
MTNSIENNDFNNRFKISDRHEQLLAVCFVALYVLVNFVYGIIDEATWDDDCAVRIYNTMIAFKNPEHLISIWNRPLFMLVFSPLIPLGKNVVFIIMILISAIGSYYLYLGAKKKQKQNAFMLVPLLLFQTFYFSVSRNAETEPLAVALICFGYYFLTHKKWMAFAIVGGLLPLARLELAVLLIIWAIYLVQEKQYQYLLILGVPTLLWNIAGGFIADDFLYVLNNTLGKDNSSNRYGHKSFSHYFQRYIYMIGPIIYLFFIVGLLYKTNKKRVDLFIYFQFILGFILYVVFSWKFNLGNAAGFLRNLIPLAPFTAMIALEGYNYLWNTITSFDNTAYLTLFPHPEKTYTELSEEDFNALNAKNRKQYLSKVRVWDKLKAERKLEKKSLIKKEKTKRLSHIIVLSVIMISGAASVYAFHSFQMKIHHDLMDTKNYTNFYLTIGVIFLVFTLLMKVRLMSITKAETYVFALLIALGAFGFTTITEPPNANMNTERTTMKEVSDFYTSSYIQNKITFVNHVWFFWANNLNRNDTSKYREVTKENLNKALPGEILIYDTHYSHRLAGNVPLKWFQKHKEWVKLSQFISPDHDFQCMIFQKTDSTNKSALQAHNNFVKNHPQNTSGFYQRALHHHKNKLFDLALNDYSISLKDTNSPFLAAIHFNRGLSYFSLQEYSLAIQDFKKNYALNDTMADALFNISSCYTNMNKSDSALFYLNKTITLRPNYQKAFINKGLLFKRANKIDEALKAFDQVLTINPKYENALLQRAQINYEHSHWKSCITDLTSIIKLKPQVANNYFIRGLCYQQLHQNQLSCNDWSKATSLGDPRTQQYLNFYCQ